MVDGIGKPVDAVLLTHAHPDHYAGLHNVTNGLDVPIISLPAIRDLARRDDKLKNDFFSPMLGSEWPTERIFPTHTVKEGETLRFGDISFDVMDIGPAESHHDSIFILRDSEPTAFIGDLAYTLMHPYMVDTHNDKWIRALDRMQSEFSEGTIFHVGHGPAVTPIFLRGQVDYLRMFEKCLRAEDWSDEKEAFEKIFNKMREYLPHDELLPLLEWSILPNAKNLGLI
ncbi:MBL fold metallo-hydrolase [Salmonella enterica subsp. enterica]|nr:MBL fold metallo-hydrolase [Salmonella enterica subsp. enterica]ECJ6738233.1 MBL fold metallo-hydrolase [Salmonella enterica subsp. enterica]